MTTTSSVSRRSARSTTFHSLSIPSFRLWFSGQSAAFLSFHMQVVGLALLIVELTGSGVMVGAVTAAQFVPSLVFSPWAGVLCDRFDRRRLMVVAQLAALVLAITLSALVLADAASAASVAVLAFLSGTAFAFDQPAKRTFISDLVPDDKVINAVSLHSSLGPFGRIVGPAAAGFLAATVGLGWCFLAGAVLMAYAVLSLLLLDRAAIRVATPIGRAQGQIRAGFDYVRSDRVILVNIVMITVLATLAFNWNVTLILLVGELDGGTAAFAVLSTLMGVGSLIGTLAMARHPSVGARMIATRSVVYGVACAALAFAPILALAALASVVVGALFMQMHAAMSAGIQITTVPAMRGRVAAIFAMCFIGGHALGAPLIGWLAETAGPRAAITFGGAACVAIGVFGLTSARRHTPALKPTDGLPTVAVEDAGLGAGPRVEETR